MEDEDPRRAGHAVSVGLREFVGIDDGLDEALRQARAAGAALIGAHPYSLERALSASRVTARFSEEPEWAAEALDRFELLNRDDVFGWVAERKLPAVASGDFHRLEHLATWKTMLGCAKEEPRRGRGAPVGPAVRAHARGANEEGDTACRLAAPSRWASDSGACCFLSSVSP